MQAFWRNREKDVMHKAFVINQKLEPLNMSVSRMRNGRGEGRRVVGFNFVFGIQYTKIDLKSYNNIYSTQIIVIK